MKRILIGGIRGGAYALVDDQDFEVCSKKSWYMSSKGRPKAIHKIGSCWKQVFMHRLILDSPKGELVDHIDGNPLNNQRENLRVCSYAQNQQNRRPRVAGYKGVQLNKKKWEVRITVAKKKLYLGCFNTKEEAALVYNEAAKRYFGEFAWLNKV